MTVAFENPVMAGPNLARPVMQSPDFSIAGRTGWAIFQNGSAYFFNVTATGTITASAFVGTDFVINSAGAFFYSGAPAAGNLAASVTPQAGTDGFGNAYLQGPSSYAVGLGLATQLLGNATVWYSGPVSGAGPWTQAASLSYPGGGLPLIETGNGFQISSGQQIHASEPSTAIPEVWHDLGAIAAGWTTTGFARYKLLPDGMVQIRMQDITPPAAAPVDGTVVWTAANGLPAAYVPLNTTRIPCYATATLAASGTPAFEFHTDGSIQVYGIHTANPTRLDGVFDITTV